MKELLIAKTFFPGIEYDLKIITVNILVKIEIPLLNYVIPVIRKFWISY